MKLSKKPINLFNASSSLFWRDCLASNKVSCQMICDERYSGDTEQIDNVPDEIVGELEDKYFKSDRVVTLINNAV